MLSILLSHTHTPDVLRESGDLEDIDGRRALRGGQESVDYEVPEKIKTLHHLALQYVNQVGCHCAQSRLCVCMHLYGGVLEST